MEACGNGRSHAPPCSFQPMRRSPRPFDRKHDLGNRVKMSPMKNVFLQDATGLCALGEKLLGCAFCVAGRVQMNLRKGNTE